MNYLATNLKLLRSHHKLSQSGFAEKVSVSRTNIAKYEGAIHEPSIDVVVKMARYFNLSLDQFITLNLSSLSADELDHLNHESNSKIFPVQVDAEGNDLIEIVPHNAQAGYMGMYSDPGYIETLDHISLPILHNSGKCRAFPISGDSMPPFGDGSYVIGEYVSDRKRIKEGDRYVILSRDEGIVFKRVYLHKDNDSIIVLHSDNMKYESFEMQWSEVVEIWKYKAAVTVNETKGDDTMTEMMKKLEELQNDLKKFSSRFS